MGVICYLGIGSNLGNRHKNIKTAVEKINRLKETKIIKISGIRQTNPVGGVSGQRKFLNAVLKIKTNLAPLALLKNLQKIERQLGRPKNHIHLGPRTIDLDILFYGNEVIKTANLNVPHPRIFERDFVAKPLLEII